MGNTSRIETREISDAELDRVAGGLSVSGTVNGLTGTLHQGPGGMPVLDGSAKSLTLTVSDIPLGPIQL